MNYCGLKAAKAFAFGLVVSGLVVACNEASPVAKTIAPEAEVASASAGKSMQSAQLTAAERETKKREFFAKPEVKEMSAGLEEIAEAVAVAVEDKELRERIYAKCMEKFDGETNVLWQQLEADNNLRAKGGWNKRVDDLVGKGRKNAVVKGAGNVDAAIKKFEKIVNAPLHLFWMYPSQWDKKATPLIAYLPFDADTKTRQSIPAFDSKGNRFELDRKGELAKKRPVIVITVNERTQPDGKVRPNILSSSLTAIDPQIFKISNGSGKNKATLQSSFYPTRISFYSATLNKTQWTDPDGEWTGGQEFFYLFECGNTFDNSNQWMGLNEKNGVAQGWGNTNMIPAGQGGNISLPSHPFTHSWDGTQKVKFRYFEADFLWFDDEVEVHIITNPGISWPNTNNTYLSAVKMPATYVFHE